MRAKIIILLTIVMSMSVIPTRISAATNAIPAQIKDFAFQPNPIIVQVGRSVQWTNTDGVAHTVTFDSLSIDSGAIDPDKTFTATFSTIGKFTYHCNIHPTMVGEVDVTPIQDPPPPVTPRIWQAIVLR